MSRREKELQEEENKKAAEAARKAQQAKDRAQRAARREHAVDAKALSPTAKATLTKRAAPEPPAPPPAYDQSEGLGHHGGAAGDPAKEQATRPTESEDQRGAAAPDVQRDAIFWRTKEATGQAQPTSADTALPSAPPSAYSTLFKAP